MKRKALSWKLLKYRNSSGRRLPEVSQGNSSTHRSPAYKLTISLDVDPLYPRYYTTTAYAVAVLRCDLKCKSEVIGIPKHRTSWPNRSRTSQ